MYCWQCNRLALFPGSAEFAHCPKTAISFSDLINLFRCSSLLASLSLLSVLHPSSFSSAVIYKQYIRSLSEKVMIRGDRECVEMIKFQNHPPPLIIIIVCLCVVCVAGIMFYKHTNTTYYITTYLIEFMVTWFLRSHHPLDRWVVVGNLYNGTYKCVVRWSSLLSAHLVHVTAPSRPAGSSVT